MALAAALVIVGAPVDARQTDQPTPLSPPTTERAGTALLPVEPAPSTASDRDEHRHPWLEAFTHSIQLLAIEHGTRIAFQEKTRRELGGPFFRDYVDSIRIPTDWEDGDSWAINYIGHPIHGAAAGYLWRDAHHEASSEIFDNSSEYWAVLGRAGAWIAVYHLQFEFGPLSEASIGNVGLDPSTSGWVDHAVTPAVGFGMMVAEDALDKYFIKWTEHHVDNRVLRAFVRVAFNPARALANVAQGRLPWNRNDRSINARY